MRRLPVLLTLCFALSSAPASAQAVAPSFTVSPASVAPGKPLTFAFRANGSGSVRARVDLLAPGRSPVRAKLGMVRAGRAVKIAWTPPSAVAAGAYTARLVITAHRSTEYERTPLSVVVAPTSGSFPVQGPYDFGGPDARFGAQRDGHVHQGQDVVAAEGTPIVSPVAGSVTVVDFQAGGAGNYVIIHGADARDYVFMHLEDASTVVKQGDAVTPGAPLGKVGATGDADGPHLHFEIWPGGWYAKGSQPIDPLPQLQAWAG